MTDRLFDANAALAAEMVSARSVLDRATTDPHDPELPERLARVERAAGYFAATRGEGDTRARELGELARRARNAIAAESGGPLQLSDAEVAELPQEQFEELRRAGRIA